MAYRELYEQQVRLLMRVLPLVAQEKDFALKGGTAINLFIRNLPRLSVDIDLVYIPIADWGASLAAIDGGMKRIAEQIKAAGPQVAVTKLKGFDAVTKLVAREKNSDVQIKIEITPVLRGAVYEPVVMAVSEGVEDRFGFAEIRVVSFADLFAGKIVAALDRQHPRDLFDVRDLLAAEGITDDLRRAFIVYLLAHPRPMHEILAGRFKDIAGEFEHAFDGMTAEPVELAELTAAREALLRTMLNDMPGAHKDFLIGFEAGKPDWVLLGLPNVQHLPAVKWRQRNLDTLTEDKRRAQVESLRDVLNKRRP